MKFVMTGHRGLIGSFLLEKIKERGDEAVLLLDKREGNDILNIDRYGTDGRVDVLIHLAAFCKINKTIENPSLAFESNVAGINKVLEFCRKREIPKIVFSSSARVLSKEKNPYTASKIYGEELVKGYSQCYGIDYVIVRPSTVYGPFNDFSRRLIDIFILNALQGKELKIYGDENKTLDFTYVDDFVDGMLIAMEQRNRDFNISYGESVNVNWLADYIIRLAGKGYKRFYPKEVAQPQESFLDTSTIRELGYKPRIGIKEGVRKTFVWYRKNLENILISRIEN